MMMRPRHSLTCRAPSFASPAALTQFVGAIRGTESIKLTSFEDGVRYMAFTDAVTESLTTGREVPVEQA